MGALEGYWVKINIIPLNYNYYHSFPKSNYYRLKQSIMALYWEMIWQINLDLSFPSSTKREESIPVSSTEEILDARLREHNIGRLCYHTLCNDFELFWTALNYYIKQLVDNFLVLVIFLRDSSFRWIGTQNDTDALRDCHSEPCPEQCEGTGEESKRN